MGWRERLRKASFRGVSFFVDQSSAGFGRRNVDHEYPQRDKPFSEDLGRKQQQFSFDAYVLGAGYIRARNALIDACEQPDRGELIHPYYGSKFVVCKSCEVRESVGEGGMARFSLTFHEAGARAFPNASVNPLSRLGIAAARLNAASIASFGSKFLTSGFPGFIVSSAKTSLSLLGQSLTAMAGIASGGFVISGLIREFGNLDELLQAPAILGQEIVNVMKGVGNLSLDTRGIADAYKSLFGFGDDHPAIFSPAVGVMTPSRKQEIKNRDAITNLTKRVAIAEASVAVAKRVKHTQKLISSEPQPVDALSRAPLVEGDYVTNEDGTTTKTMERVFTTYESIIADRDTIFEAIDAQANALNDDAVYSALQAVRAELNRAMPSASISLPNLVTYYNQQTQPSLVLAYRLSGSLGIETDLVNRNRVEHPGFIAGGIDLQVVRNG